MKNNNEIEIDRKTEFLSSQLETIRFDFRNNLKHEIEQYRFKIMCKYNLEEIQYKIDSFLHKNDLNISVDAKYHEQTLIVIGRTLIDEIVWEHLNKNYR